MSEVYSDPKNKPMTADGAVTVLVAIRDRYDYRIWNALSSVRTQTYKDIDIIMVDYGSDRIHKNTFEMLCYEFEVAGVWTNTSNKWNKGHALNIALHRTSTKYVLVLDVDVILQCGYIAECVALAAPGERFLYADMLDLDAGDIIGRLKLPDDYDRLREKAKPRAARMGTQYPFGCSILFGPLKVLWHIGGYDERYKLWGCEDTDLIIRLSKIGAQLHKLVASSHIHQWHRRFENVSEEPGFHEQVAVNRKYMKSTESIVRNKDGWGNIAALY